MHRDWMLRYSHMTGLIALVRDGADGDTSSGDVTVSRQGRVRVRYRLSSADGEHLFRAIEAAARIQLAAGIREVRTLHTHPFTIRTEKDLATIRQRGLAANDIGLFSAHVNGTCRMGTDRATSGTNPNGERWDAPGLFVADGSLLPTAPGVNPQETIMALASVVAQRIAGRRTPG
jgi:choline dehydrogenase-like flavoprotein